MPPVTPRRTRTSVLDAGDGQHALVDLPHGDRERLVLLCGRHQRADELEEALLELRVVGVDLPGALRRVDDERVFGVDPLEQIVDGRVGDAFRGGDGSVQGDLLRARVSVPAPPHERSPWHTCGRSVYRLGDTHEGE